MLPRISGAALLALALAVPCHGQRTPSFPSSDVCALCHRQIPPPAVVKQPAGESIAPLPLWRNSMMAASADDPYWRARVRFESKQAEAGIEKTCLRCHAPAQQALRLSDLKEVNEGVTCSVCHQISDRNLGQRASLSGGFSISDEGEAFGPHRNPFGMPMMHHTELTPTFSPHVLESAFCATCHTVVTHPAGTASGTEFVEQAPWLEWLSGSFAREGRSCQSCHIPVLTGPDGEAVPSYIAHRPPGGPFPPTRPRTPFGLHLFIGANYQTPEMLGSLMPELAQQMKITSGRALKNLQSALALHATARSEGRQTVVRVAITNLTGHKLPTGYPGRRMWLHLRARNAEGKVIFESGAWDAVTGELNVAPGYQPHYPVIDSPKQVQIYETEMQDATGNPTLSLARAAAFRKDNRIPPRGFDPGRILSLHIGRDAIEPAGIGADSDFLAGSDTVIYRIPRAERVAIEACYQAVKPSHAAVLDPLPRFNRAPAVVASVEVAETR